MKEIQSVFQGNFKVVSKKFQGCFKGISIKIKGCFKRPLRVIQDNFKGIQKNFKGCIKEVSRMFKEKKVSSFKGYSRMFQFNFAWHSSQLPDQKEGLFFAIKRQLIYYEMVEIITRLS